MPDNTLTLNCECAICAENTVDEERGGFYAIPPIRTSFFHKKCAETAIGISGKHPGAGIVLTEHQKDPKNWLAITDYTVGVVRAVLEDDNSFFNVDNILKHGKQTELDRYIQDDIFLNNLLEWVLKNAEVWGKDNKQMDAVFSLLNRRTDCWNIKVSSDKTFLHEALKIINFHFQEKLRQILSKINDYSHNKELQWCLEVNNLQEPVTQITDWQQLVANYGDPILRLIKSFNVLPSRRPEILKFMVKLLNMGVPYNQISAEYGSVFHIAAAAENPEILKCLFDKFKNDMSTRHLHTAAAVGIYILFSHNGERKPFWSLANENSLPVIKEFFKSIGIGINSKLEQVLDVLDLLIFSENPCLEQTYDESNEDIEAAGVLMQSMRSSIELDRLPILQDILVLMETINDKRVVQLKKKLLGYTHLNNSLHDVKSHNHEMLSAAVKVYESHLESIQQNDTTTLTARYNHRLKFWKVCSAFLLLVMVIDFILSIMMIVDEEIIFGDEGVPIWSPIMIIPFLFACVILKSVWWPVVQWERRTITPIELEYDVIRSSLIPGVLEVVRESVKTDTTLQRSILNYYKSITNPSGNNEQITTRNLTQITHRVSYQ